MDVVQQVGYISDISRISEIRVVNISYLLVCVEDNNCDGGYECIDGTCRYLKIIKMTDFVEQNFFIYIFKGLLRVKNVWMRTTLECVMWRR